MTPIESNSGEQFADNSEVWDEFMSSEFAQTTLEEENLAEPTEQTAKSKKQKRTAAYEQFPNEETGGPNKLGEGPTVDEVALAHPGGGTTTEGISGVRSERSQGDGFSPQYEMATAAVPASDDGAHVETIVEQQDKDMQTATSQPTGLPNANKGEQGGLKWASVKVKQLTKKADRQCPECNGILTTQAYCVNCQGVLAFVNPTKIVKATGGICPDCGSKCAANGFCPSCREIKDVGGGDEKKEESDKEKKAALVPQTREAILRMTRLADELDTEGLTDEAAELDALIADEVQALEGKSTEEEPMEKTEVQARARAKKRTRAALLRMTKLADELDAEGLIDEAAELDALVADEVQALEGKTTKETTEQTARARRRKVKAQAEEAEEVELDADDLDELVEEIMTEDLETA